MKIASLSIKNFRALDTFHLQGLRNGVVLAGSNGCGKSCVLDAIRLLKAAYGSYDQDEWKLWQSEFQIAASKGKMGIVPFAKDKQKEVELRAEFSFSEQEQIFLKENSKDLLLDLLWKEKPIEGPIMGLKSGTLLRAANQRANRNQVSARVKKDLPAILKAIEHAHAIGSISIDPASNVSIVDSLLLELIFSIYEPQSVGVIDHHSAHRVFNRETISNINIAVESTAQRFRQSALYNNNGKYSNIKTEMASAYVRHLIKQKADGSSLPEDSLTKTLQELFSIFFPGKRFAGPQPTADGKLSFPIQIESGGEHDIDDLSSGEKEVLYGYLRIERSALRNSIIMIDEPELHLNPRLLSGLASFYYRQFAESRGNQLWLITHSDALIRETVSSKHFDVFHIQKAESINQNQAELVKGHAGLERVIIGLIGDLAAYRPHAKIVIFESTDSCGFDMYMTTTLFPEFAEQINAISGGNKRRVADLYEVLEKARQDGHVPGKFYSISDLDDEVPLSNTPTRLQWDVYHIENYLLDPIHIQSVVHELGGKGVFQTPESVTDELKSCAEETIPILVQHKLRIYANSLLTKAIDLGCAPARSGAAELIDEAIGRTFDRIKSHVHMELSLTKLQEFEAKKRSECQQALATDDWKRKFRGRDVLTRFVGRHGKGVPYEQFRNLVISRMRDAKFKPPGMLAVIEKILKRTS